MRLLERYTTFAEMATYGRQGDKHRTLAYWSLLKPVDAIERLRFLRQIKRT